MSLIDPSGKTLLNEQKLEEAAAQPTKLWDDIEVQSIIISMMQAMIALNGGDPSILQLISLRASAIEQEMRAELEGGDGDGTPDV